MMYGIYWKFAVEFSLITLLCSFLYAPTVGLWSEKKNEGMSSAFPSPTNANLRTCMSDMAVVGVLAKIVLWTMACLTRH